MPINGMYPQCEECGMQVNPDQFGASNEQTTDCMQQAEKIRQHAAVVASQEALDQRFSIRCKELEQVDGFRYIRG